MTKLVSTVIFNVIDEWNYKEKIKFQYFIISNNKHDNHLNIVVFTYFGNIHWL